MQKRLLSEQWYFSENNRDYDLVDLPHDYAVGKERDPQVLGGDSNGYYPDAEGNYVKHLTFEKNKHYILHLDGAYMRAHIFLNENHVAYHPYGYSPFLADLTPHLMVGRTNKLKININPLIASTRWYTGNGIYRDVFLWEGGNIRIEPWDLFVSTASVANGTATIRTRFEVAADRSRDVTVKLTFRAPNGAEVACDEVAVKTKKGKKVTCERLTVIPSPLLWEPESPYLYTLHADVLDGETLCDSSDETFGIRTVTANAKQGLLLNGKPLKLRGGCIHHDHGVLGAAAYPAAEARKIRILKEAGFNAVRCAHNPPSLAMLEVCDRLGMIVMDEAYDAWNKGFRLNDYHAYFEDWGIRDLTYMVQRDRNHPSVFTYSIGNEILEVDGTAGAYEWSKRLVDEVKKHDDTRLVTSAVNKGFVARTQPDSIDPPDYREYMKERFYNYDPLFINRTTEPLERPLDIVGYNYYFRKYGIDHKCYPDRVMWGSETHVTTFYESWQSTLERPYVIGDFTWTAYDNMGEVGAGRFRWAREGTALKGLSRAGYPWRTCYQGDHDLCGYRRPQSYFREAVWLGNCPPRIFVTHPEHYGETFSGTGWHWFDVNETWTFEDRYVGRPVTVETYTDADEILWLVNGREIGRCVPEKAIARIDTVYEKGNLTAIAFKNGEEVGRRTLETTAPASGINVKPDKDTFRADGRDLCYFEISLVDPQGRLVTEAANELHASVTGGELLGIYSGDPANEDRYGSPVCHAFKGRALAVVRAKKADTVRLHVFADDLAVGYAAVQAIE